MSVFKILSFNKDIDDISDLNQAILDCYQPSKNFFKWRQFNRNI